MGKKKQMCFTVSQDAQLEDRILLTEQHLIQMIWRMLVKTVQIFQIISDWLFPNSIYMLRARYSNIKPMNQDYRSW